MPEFYLMGDEAIIQTSENVILEKERFEAILTNRRLILVRTGGDKASSREILLREVGSAIAGESILGEPTITLTFTTPDGVLHAQELVFPRKSTGYDGPHYTEWVNRLKEQVKIAAQEPFPITDSVATEDYEKFIPGEADKPGKMMEGRGKNSTGPMAEVPDSGKTTSPEDSSVQAAPESVPLIAPADFPKPGPVPPEAPTPSAEKSGRGVTIVIVLIIAAAFIGAAYYYTLHRGQISPAPEQIESTLVETTMPATTHPMTTPRPTTAETIAMTPSPITPQSSGGEVIIPPTGIWVRVQYPGNFSGSVGIQGSMRDVSGNGDRFFQIPSTGKIIDASIQKQDNSGRMLEVAFYNNGTLIKQGNTTAPHGTLNLNIWI
ncbi:MAG TPA: hypothetical protein PLO06_03405 [Methanoregulaceae archaeon]|nr:hypothetical protein [Methanoregulaceae archaeon]HPD74722.1 hypothetical protein [Methanoregulaceae archaeon]